MRLRFSLIDRVVVKIVVKIIVNIKEVKVVFTQTTEQQALASLLLNGLIEDVNHWLD